MKVNLTIDSPNALNGYLNLDPIVKDPGISKVKVDIMNIDDYVDNAECTELRAWGVLTYYDSNKIDNMINNWIAKLRIGAIISISDIDIERVFKAYQRGEINITQMNSLLFGEQQKNWDLRKCGLNMESVSEALKAKGLEITEKTYHNFNFVVKAKRVK